MNSLLSLVFVALVVLACSTVEGRREGKRGPPRGRGRSSSSSSSSSESVESAELEHMVKTCQLNDTQGNILDSSVCPENSTCDFPSASGLTFNFGGSVVPAVVRQIVFCSVEGVNETTITNKLSEHSCESATTTCRDGSNCSFQITVGSVVINKCKTPENFDELRQVFPHHRRGGHSGGSSSDESD